MQCQILNTFYMLFTFHTNHIFYITNKNIDKVFYTHSHADQTHGINELRVFSLKNKKNSGIFQIFQGQCDFSRFPRLSANKF